MKIFIAFLLIFLSFSDGQNTTTTTTTPSTPSTSSTTSTTSSTTTTTTSTTVTSLTTITTNTQSPNTTASPTSDVTVNVTWSFSSETKVTNVVMIVKNLQLSQWAAIGLGQNRAMGEAHVFMCKRSANDTIVVNRYVNPDDHNHPVPAGSEQGGLFTPLSSQTIEGVVICQFKLSNFTTGTLKQLGALRPLSQSQSYYPLFAIGRLDTDNEPQKHSEDSAEAQSNSVQLNRNETVVYRINSDNSITYIRAHGIIMVFTWMLIVSTGVLISRYFKNAWLTTLICGKNAWFAAHRFLMSIAAILTVLGFLFILVGLKGTWVDRHDEPKHFTHSVTGALVISFAFFQPFLALYRCEPVSRYRFIFDYIHRFIGFSALLLSIVTLFLATYFKLFTTGEARIIVIVWIIWIIFIFIAFEVVQQFFRAHNRQSGYTNIDSSNKTIEELVESPTSSTAQLNRDNNEEETSPEEKIKNILLAIHILIAIVLCVIFSTLIA